MREQGTEVRREPICSCPPLGLHAWVNGVRIDPLGPSEALDRLATFLSCGATHIVNHLPAHPTVLARRDSAYRDSLNRADMNVADGMGVVWACRHQGFAEMKERVYGPDFMLGVIAWGEHRGLSHAFMGGTEATVNLLVDELRRRYPKLIVTGAYAPPFRDVTAKSVAEDLSQLAAAADVLWVGLGTPKQQLWADFARSHATARAILTVGAAYDFIAGVKPQAPKWMQRNGLEWAFRLATEPRRLWRRALLDNAVFAWAVLRDHGFGSRPGSDRGSEHGHP
jgi:N-acetylglucosaminyldiphosphoundecaprenol N-acetyl-beta-D-mannosaminyltransferase